MMKHHWISQGRLLILLASVVLLVWGSLIANPSRTLKVTYVSTEYVYVDGGTADGLTTGTHLTIVQKDSVLAELEVAFSSERSAACRIITAATEIKAGMTVTSPGAPDQDTTATAKPADTTAAVAQPAPAPVTVPRVTPTITGSVSVIFDQSIDNTAFGNNLTQSTGRLNLRGRHIGGHDISFSIQMRARHDQRSRPFLNDVGRNAWVNRLYEFYVSYDAKDAPVNFYAGRIPIRRVGSVGFVDGLLVENRIAGSLRSGFYGGAQSKWQYADQTTSLQKYGTYLNYSSGSYATNMLDLTLALSGEYHSATASRELVYSQGRFNRGDRFYISAITEVDVNRGWRMQKVGRTFSLSSVYLDSRLKLTNRLATGLSYDSRENYWTYDIRTLRDSLFDSHLRQGLRARVDYRLFNGYFASANVGTNRRNGDPGQSNSYGFSLSKGAFLFRRSDVNLQYSAFSGLGQSGDNFSARLGSSFLTRNYVSVGYGFYRFRWSSAVPLRTNTWLELSTRLEFLKNFFLYGLFQENTGDDIKGHRVQLELGHSL